ncbi:tripartite tricarboxylate transporter substrate binding protein [Bradyrhizobium lablabi]|uniref:Bug family tripartite tricarboxylate transporter substrate binding protein n=1 Tax=Bradyrhizobium lablabi TaxID=722472 RepID=UPI001BA8E7BD|nr:tripartite tricarboxylate transporter substrate binding protein [Bradyrhizobium lablabi]MBR1126217.1 tripartite tricarboxylate transporter substrate binding protein [Bradyrhizobium lablabi]
MSAISRRRFIGSAAAASALPLIGAAQAQQTDWPNRQVRIIAGYPAGGQTDLFARTYGEYIRAETGQNVVVENKAGASGSVAAVEAKRAAPDGYTLMFTISTTMIMNRVLIKDIPYDAEKDFVLVSIMPAGSLPFAVAEKTGAKTLAEFIAYAKKAEKVNIGTYGAGSYAHMAVAEMNKQYGLKMEAVHYRGEAPMWTDLAGGFIDGAHGSYSAALSVLQSGRGRAVAVSRKRMSVLPDVPTFTEQGATSRIFQLTGFQCCAVPAGTPPEIIQKLSKLLVAGGRSEKVLQVMKSFGVDDTAMTFEATQKLYKEESPVWIEAVTSLGIAPS